MPESNFSMFCSWKLFSLLESRLRAENGHVPLKLALVEFVGKFAVHCS